MKNFLYVNPYKAAGPGDSAYDRARARIRLEGRILPLDERKGSMRPLPLTIRLISYYL